MKYDFYILFLHHRISTSSFHTTFLQHLTFILRTILRKRTLMYIVISYGGKRYYLNCLKEKRYKAVITFFRYNNGHCVVDLNLMQHFDRVMQSNKGTGLQSHDHSRVHDSFLFIGYGQESNNVNLYSEVTWLKFVSERMIWMMCLQF